METENEPDHNDSVYNDFLFDDKVDYFDINFAIVASHIYSYMHA